jgi:hypothetical protein
LAQGEQLLNTTCSTASWFMSMFFSLYSLAASVSWACFHFCMWNHHIIITSRFSLSKPSLSNTWEEHTQSFFFPPRFGW